MLRRGWNFISLNLMPSQEMWEREDGPDIIRMTDQLRIDENSHRITIMKDIHGRFYSPTWEFNNIPYWNLAEGYQICVSETTATVWAGLPIPADADIPLRAGWNLSAYYPSYELPCASPDFYALSNILDQVVIAKDENGMFAAPSFDFSSMPPWRATKGYQIQVNQAVVLNYPPQPQNIAFAESEQNSPFTGNVSTPFNMSVLLNEISGISGKISRIQALNTQETVVGEGLIDKDDRCGLAVWGDDPTTVEVDGLKEGEAFELRCWNGSAEVELQVDNVLAGPGLAYQTDDFTVLDVSLKPSVPESYYLSQNYPNPFNNATRISYGLPEAGEMSLKVYDLSGRVVQTLVNCQIAAGHHAIEWDARRASSGLYLVQLESVNYRAVRKVVLAK